MHQIRRTWLITCPSIYPASPHDKLARTLSDSNTMLSNNITVDLAARGVVSTVTGTVQVSRFGFPGQNS